MAALRSWILLHWLLCSIPVLFVGAATVGSQNISSDAFFYGLSPPVYPTPKGTGTGSWASAYAKAAALVGQMTLDEKTNLTVGIDGSKSENGCSGSIAAIPRLGFPGFCLNDAGNGVRATDFVNAYASGISVGASWNKNLAYQRGRAMGGEFKTKGVNIALGPVVGPLGRVAEAGRNWEGFSNDPYLSGSLAFETVRGIQERGVITSTKHFIGNEQETNRIPGLNAQGQTTEAVSSNIDDKTLHELYLWPFQDALHAGSGNIMCSYQRVNNSYGCANSNLLNGILKTELGFQGFVVSDWGAQHAGVATALAGLDMAMPDSKFWAPGLTTATQNGSVPLSRIDDMATRIIAAWYQMGQDQNYPPRGVGIPVDLTKQHKIVNARDPGSKQTLLDGAVEGHVLVKNKKNALPLKSPQLLSLYGYDAQTANQNDINLAWTLGFESSDPVAAIAIFTGGAAPQTAPRGTMISGGGSGANSPAYISAPFDAIQERVYQDNTALLWDFGNSSTSPVVDPASDACLVFINSFSSEAVDRTTLNDTYSDSLVNGVANQCNNTIVIIHNAGIRILDAFIAHPNVTAVLLAHLPGQDSGRALVSILWGDVSPSGKLPYTLAKSAADYGALLGPSLPADIHYLFPQSNFSEGVYIDYRAFDKAGITPRFEFGFGLSYTTFSYSNLQISKLPGVSTAAYPVGPIEQGGQTDLWDVIVQVTADITNTGAMAASEIAQLYIGIPGGPVRQLRGFSKVGIQPGQVVSVHFDLLRRDLSTWDVAAQKWNLQKGSYNVSVGASSRDLRLNGTLVI